MIFAKTVSCCAKCNSEDIEVRGWITINTNKPAPGSEFQDIEDQETWCPHCEDHTGLEKLNIYTHDGEIGIIDLDNGPILFSSGKEFVRWARQIFKENEEDDTTLLPITTFQEACVYIQEYCSNLSLQSKELL